MSFVRCVLVVFFCFPGQLANARVVLDVIPSIQDSTLSDDIKAALGIHGFVSFDEVVRYFIGSYFSKGVAEEVVRYLDSFHLRLGMTDSEIEYFNEVGRAPETSEVSGIRILDISYRIIFALEAEGLRTLGDLKKLSDKQLWSIPGVGQVSLKKIYEALAKVRDKPNSTCRSKLAP